MERPRGTLKSGAGISLVELGVAMAVALVLMTMAVMNWGSVRAGRRLHDGALQLGADLRYACQVATSEGGATFDLGAFPDGYAVRNAAGEIVYRRSLQGLTVLLPGGAGTISCSQSGTLSAGGTVTLTDPGANRSVTLTLIQATGLTAGP